MGALSWYRAAQKAVGMSPMREFPNLEALLETESGQPHNDYRVLSWIFPPVLLLGGWIAILDAVLTKNFGLLWCGVGIAGFGGGVWFFLDHLDKTIPKSRAKIRKLSQKIWLRYRKITNIVGVSPALMPAVGEMLEEAAGIYLRHSKDVPKNLDVASGSRERALRALEDAMARMLELGEPPTVRGQELEMGAGWAEPLLAEMRETDRMLERHVPAELIEPRETLDPLAALREARIELQRVDTAVEELEQR